MSNVAIELGSGNAKAHVEKGLNVDEIDASTTSSLVSSEYENGASDTGSLKRKKHKRGLGSIFKKLSLRRKKDHHHHHHHGSDDAPSAVVTTDQVSTPSSPESGYGTIRKPTGEGGLPNTDAPAAKEHVESEVASNERELESTSDQNVEVAGNEEVIENGGHYVEKSKDVASLKGEGEKVAGSENDQVIGNGGHHVEKCDDVGSLEGQGEQVVSIDHECAPDLNANAKEENISVDDGQTIEVQDKQTEILTSVEMKKRVEEETKKSGATWSRNKLIQGKKKASLCCFSFF